MEEKKRYYGITAEIFSFNERDAVSCSGGEGAGNTENQGPWDKVN